MEPTSQPIWRKKIKCTTILYHFNISASEDELFNAISAYLEGGETNKAPSIWSLQFLMGQYTLSEKLEVISLLNEKKLNLAAAKIHIENLKCQRRCHDYAFYFFEDEEIYEKYLSCESLIQRLLIEYKGLLRTSLKLNPNNGTREIKKREDVAFFERFKDEFQKYQNNV